MIETLITMIIEFVTLGVTTDTFSASAVAVGKGTGGSSGQPSSNNHTGKEGLPASGQ
jgi:hypothetical protein